MNSKEFTIRMTPDTYEVIELLAAEADVSRLRIIDDLIVDALKDKYGVETERIREIGRPISELPRLTVHQQNALQAIAGKRINPKQHKIHQRTLDSLLAIAPSIVIMQDGEYRATELGMRYFED